MAIASWVAEKTGEPLPDYMPCRAIGIMKGTQIVGGVIIHDYRGNDCRISLALESGFTITRNHLRMIYEYVYIQLGCGRTTTVTGQENRRLSERLGYRLEGVMRKASRNNQDVFIYGMLKDECKWIKPVK